MTPKIISYIRMTDESVILDGESVYSSADGTNVESTALYRHFNIDYPKFYKMDNLCKCGFIGSELMLRHLGIDSATEKNDWAVVLFNRSSSLDDDISYNNTIISTDNYYPSPSVFVYTLANIITGEISIRNKILGETSFYILEKFSSDMLYDAVLEVLSEGSSKTVLCGWTEYLHGNTDVFMMLVSASGENQKSEEACLNFNINTINKLY